MTDALALCHDLTIRLGERVLLDGQSLDVQPGTTTVLMGPSGVGKSVLADVLFGLTDGGEVRVDGDVGVAGSRGALVFQSGGGLPHLTLRENMRLVARNRGDVDALLDNAALEPRRTAARLSGGEQRRLATARALAAGRDLLWLDEPAAGLDVHRVDALAVQLRDEAREQNIAVMVTTHRVEFAAAVADRVLFLGYDGKLVELTLPPRTPDAAVAAERIEALDSQLRDGITRHERQGGAESSGRGRWRSPLAWTGDWLFGLLGSIALLVGGASRAAVHTLGHALRLAAVEGAPFYPFVGGIFGGIFLLIFHLSLPFIDTGRVVLEFGPLIVLRLAPPFAGILVAARAGSAISAWVGQMSASRQLDALRVLDVSVRRHIAAPVWLGLTIGSIVGTALFGAALVGVFAGYLEMTEQGTLLDVVTGFDRDESMTAALKTALFGTVLSAITVSFAREPKRRPDEVASSITRSIVHCTAWIMLIELAVLALQAR